ncbi:MAG TPA: hypothetical protein VK022_02275 [Paracoccaceae bacterium]|nr:hypothetical protein [Paracoccaceae bacterium]
MRKRLGVAVTAMLLGTQLGGSADAAEPRIEQLETISQFIEKGEIESLIVYLLENPELMEGDDAVAMRLRDFMDRAHNLTTFLAFDAPVRMAFSGDSSGGGSGSIY